MEAASLTHSGVMHACCVATTRQSAPRASRRARTSAGGEPGGEDGAGGAAMTVVTTVVGFVMTLVIIGVGSPGGELCSRVSAPAKRPMNTLDTMRKKSTKARRSLFRGVKGS